MTRAVQATAFPKQTARDELLSMLAFRRPAWTKDENAFISRFLHPLGLTSDEYGNLFIRIGDAPVLWSCHTDTAHCQCGKQTLVVKGGVVTTDDKSSDCLGADCTAGVWLMVQMIRAGRPGLYIFHRAEEIGGKGSEYISEKRPDLLTGIDYAIAFDRRGRQSVITHQWGGRCCSDAFAISLAAALDMQHKLDDSGTFTDTANYTDLIGECSNVSVGYFNEHSKKEALDMDYLDLLLAALLKLDSAEFIYERKPGGDDEDYSWLYDDADQEPYVQYTSKSMARLVEDHPDEVADWIEHHGVSIDEIVAAISMRGGVVRKR